MRSIQTVNALTCMKTGVVIFNVLFWMSGVCLVVLGIWVQLELHRYLDVSSTTRTSGTGTGPYILVAAGLLIMFVGTVGCCCTSTGSTSSILLDKPGTLYLYGGVVGSIVLLEVLACAAVYSYRTDLGVAFEHGLNQSMQVYNVDHPRSSRINLLQTHVSCCGINGPEDWKHTRYGKVPGSCCVTNMGCDTKMKREIHRKGCNEAVRSMIDASVDAACFTTGGIGLFQGCGVLLSIAAAKLIQKTKYEQIG